MQKIKELINKLKERNLLFLLIPFGLLLVMVIIIIFVSVSQPSDPSQTQQKPSSPKLSNTTTVSSVSPRESAQNVGIFSPISATFTTPISKQDQSSIQISLNPAVEGEQSWSSDNKTLTFTPSLLTNNQIYVATVSYKQNVYTWRFKIVSEENTRPEDQEKIQDIADANYLEWEKSVNQSYPWLEKLPLETENYFFYFDIDKKSFVGQLYPSGSSDVSEADQVAAMKAEIMTSLTNLAIPTTFPFDWQITSETSASHE